MNGIVSEPFADTSYLIALINKSDALHPRAVACSACIRGAMWTTEAVVIETANALSRPVVRMQTSKLIDDLRLRKNVHILPLTEHYLAAGFDLYKKRADKYWGLTDCISFVVMKENGIVNALSADHHFTQAGYRALLLEEPPFG